MKRTKLVCGVGINDADYAVSICVNGKTVTCTYYRRWKTMIQRCYSSSLHERCPTYIGCTVSSEWLSFMSFKKWMEGQDWQDKQLDKDIIRPENKVYCSDFCCFVPGELNKLLTDSAKIRGKYPQGVYLNKVAGKFQAYMKKSSVKRSLGYFGTAKEASEAYIKAKSEYIRSVALEQTDPRVMVGLIKHAEMLQMGY